MHTKYRLFEHDCFKLSATYHESLSEGCLAGAIVTSYDNLELVIAMNAKEKLVSKGYWVTEFER